MSALLQLQWLSAAVSRTDSREWVRLAVLALTYVVTIVLEVSGLRRLMAPHGIACASQMCRSDSLCSALHLVTHVNCS